MFAYRQRAFERALAWMGVASLAMLCTLLAILAASSCSVSDRDGSDGDEDPFCDCRPPDVNPYAPIGTLKAGAARAPMRVPAGVPLGGYLERQGSASPWAALLGGSTGFAQRLWAKALALENGRDFFVLLSAPMGIASDPLLYRVTQKVCRLSGLDLRGRILLNATGTRSGPAAYWNTPVGLSRLGMDLFSPQVFERISDDLASAVAASLEEMADARLGVLIQEDFDSRDRVTRDRRCQNADYKEDRLLVMRVDADGGGPLALVFSFGSDGDCLSESNTLLSGDLPGMVEMKLDEGYPGGILAMFLQGASGDVEPAGADEGFAGLERAELIADRVVPQIMEAYRAIRPSETVQLEMVHTRIPVSREDIGYGYREFGFFDERGRLHTYKKGALFCGPSGFSDAEHQSVVDCGDFSTTLEDGYLGCEMDVSDHVAGDLDLFAQTHLASIRIGDVFFPALPGRAGSLLAADLRLRLSVAEGASMESIYVLGGSQDHQFVLLKQEDWLQGGAETADSMWGYYFGDYIEDASIDLTRALFTREHEEIAPAAGPPLTPATNSSMSSGAEALDAGTAAADPAPVIRRQGFASFSWYGGEPETDLPVALVQRLDGDDDWEPVQRSNGFGLTSDGMEMILEHQAVPGYREDPDATARRYRWTVLWEILADQPTGTYRFAVSGKQGDPGAPRAYSLDSRPFTIERSPDLSVAMLSAEQIGEDRVRFTVEALYPPTDGGFRLRDDRVPSSQHIPVRTGNAIVTVTAGTGSDIMEVQCGYDADVQAFRGIFFKTHPQGTVYRAEVKGGDVTDGYGNTSSGASGSLEFQ